MFAFLLNVSSQIEYYLMTFVTYHALWACIILSLVIFLQFAFLPTSFFPGDSLLILAGVVAAQLPEMFHIHLLFLSIFFSALIGAHLSYFLGEYLGSKLFTAKKSMFFKPKYIKKANKLYKDWGGNIIFLEALFQLYVHLLLSWQA